jgi:hypothetical protein
MESSESEKSESEIDTRGGGDPREDGEEVGVGRVSGEDGGDFKRGDGIGVRGDGERDSGRGILETVLADQVADLVDSDIGAVTGATVRFLVTRRVRRVGSVSPDDR